MTDIIDIFLDPVNVTRMGRIFTTGDTKMRALMHEFIYGPYASGIYDVWTGTDVDLYLNQMNDEFIKFMDVRYNKRIREAHAGIASARIEMAAHLDPFDRAQSQARRVEMAQPRRPITHKGAQRSTGCAINVAQPALDCRCRGGVSGARVSAAHPRARVDGPEMRAGVQADALYARCNRNQSSAVHLMSRDDEASDVGHLSYTQQFQSAPSRAPMPYAFAQSNPWLSDPTSGSGDAQYHIIALDSQLAVYNEERTIPYGYGSTQEQLADDARVAQRYAYRTPETGVIPKTSYKRLIRAQAPSGRVTLADDRIMARDIFARDSKGFMLSGARSRTVLPPQGAQQ